RSNPRAKTMRKSGRAPRELASVQPGSARKKNAPRFSRSMAVMATGSVIVAMIVVLVVAGVVGRTVRAVRDMGDAIVADAGFGVYEMQINGNRRVPTKTIFAALGLTAGQSIFNIDLPAARARIMALD